jgi:uncharacterized repeat protein (TIGR03803 family)
MNVRGSIATALLICFCAVLPISLQAQNFNLLADLSPGNGSAPEGNLIQGVNGNFYGTSQYDGANGYGTIFAITPTGNLITLYSFCSLANCADGNQPIAGLVQDNDGNFYGTTSLGGANNSGTVFRLTPAGVLTTLYNFCSQSNCIDGSSPGQLLLGSDGRFYGTTYSGGASGLSTCSLGCGTIFAISHAGKLTTLHTFCPEVNCTDGENPTAGLVEGLDGGFYGTTTFSGNSTTCVIGCGTVFKMSPRGKLTTLYTFCAQTNCPEGGDPRSALVESYDGNFYGTTSVGGLQGCGPYAFGCGTVFQITPGGSFTTLHTFNGTDGAYEWGSLAQGTDGNFYGATFYGGTNQSCSGGCGTLYKMTSSGTLSTLYDFCSESNCSDGEQPLAGLIQSTNGKFYGVTFQGGADSFTCTFGCGSVFSIDVGLGSFIEIRPLSGKVGAPVVILGNNLSGTTAVSFNGTQATFVVVSGSQIKATVPAGATSGTVTVSTAHGALSSNQIFQVRP